MRRISLTSRLSADASHSGDVEIFLLRITHPDLDGDYVRLSSDPTARLSVEPLVYGTRSTWLSDGGDPYLFVLASALLPDDRDEQTGSTQIELEAVDQDIAQVLRSTIQRATVDIAIVRASDPDTVDLEVRDLALMSAEAASAGTITLTIGRESITSEPWPAHRMTRSLFPALFR